MLQGQRLRSFSDLRRGVRLRRGRSAASSLLPQARQALQSVIVYTGFLLNSITKKQSCCKQALKLQTRQFEVYLDARHDFAGVVADIHAAGHRHVDLTECKLNILLFIPGVVAKGPHWWGFCRLEPYQEVIVIARRCHMRSSVAHS